MLVQEKTFFRDIDIQPDRGAGIAGQNVGGKLLFRFGKLPLRLFEFQIGPLNFALRDDQLLAGVGGNFAGLAQFIFGL